MTEIIQKQTGDILESVVVGGDLSHLTPVQRMAYYQAVCDSLGINPYTKPFDYITLNGKLTLYARKDATDQLRDKKGVSLRPVKREMNTDLGIYLVEVEATTPNGRTDFATGVVSINNLKGDALANAIMKAETKAKRRATLSICGLGWMDETEIDTIKNARPVQVEDNGEIIDAGNPAVPEAAPVDISEDEQYAAARQVVYGGKLLDEQETDALKAFCVRFEVACGEGHKPSPREKEAYDAAKIIIAYREGWPK